MLTFPAPAWVHLAPGDTAHLPVWRRRSRSPKLGAGAAASQSWGLDRCRSPTSFLNYVETSWRAGDLGTSRSLIHTPARSFLGVLMGARLPATILLMVGPLVIAYPLPRESGNWRGRVAAGQ